MWIATAEANGVERATLAEYKRHVEMHLASIGTVRLSDLSAPGVRGFEDQLRVDDHSAAMVKPIRSALGMLVADTMERGLVAKNVVRDPRRKKERRAERRAKGKLKVGIDIPAPDEIRRILGVLSGRRRQERLGHSTIAMTMDTCGHLFPRGDDGSELAAAEQALFAVS